MGTDARAAEVEAVLRAFSRWARGRGDVRALALVGSWARGEPHAGSDVDLVLLTEAPARYVEGDEWPHELGEMRLLRRQRWGVITERRLGLPSGLELDVGIGAPSWASVNPLDSGTRKVATDGLRMLHDPDGLLATLVDAIGAGV